jgi:hypothetical protein
MQSHNTLRPLLIAGGVLALIVLMASVAVIRFGRAYQWGIFGFNTTETSVETTVREKKKLRKITVRKGDSAGCIEVTPDGAVRVYRTCGEELESANRPYNPKNILKLFRLVSERNLSDLPSGSEEGTLYTLMIETDEGTQVVVIVVNEDTPDPIVEIIETIEDIEEEIPEPTSTPADPLLPTPTQPPVLSGTPVPSGTPFPSAFPTPTPTGPAVDLGFLCDFIESTGPKPYNISNFVCSTGPTPFPR